MSTLVSPARPRLPGLSPAAVTPRLRAAARRVLGVLRAAARAAWLLFRLLARVLARLLDWFAEEPGRIAWAVAGLATAAATGALVGLGTGRLLARGWRLLAGTVLTGAG